MKRLPAIALFLLVSPLSQAQNWYQQRADQLERENRELKARIAKLEAQLNPDGEVSSIEDGLNVIWDNLQGLDMTDEVASTYSIGGIDSGHIYADGFQRRLAAIDTVLCVPYSEKIRAYADIYMQKRAKYLKNVIIRYERYHPFFRATFAQYGVPDEITSLCILESAVSTKALSPVGALGIWQLMPATARQYGLTVDELFGNDDRCDVVKSTNAAARMLSKMYSHLGDWKLVLLAYNCGEGRLRQAIIRAGSTDDYWRMVSFLPEETQNYVPAFMGILYALNYQDLMD